MFLNIYTHKKSWGPPPSGIIIMEMIKMDTILLAVIFMLAITTVLITTLYMETDSNDIAEKMKIDIDVCLGIYNNDYLICYYELSNKYPSGDVYDYMLNVSEINKIERVE